MMNENMCCNEDMMRMHGMKKDVMMDINMSIAFSVFGMLLIFGLGFVFPTINPYVVIKWIIIVAGVVFLISFLRYLVYMGMKMKMMRRMKTELKGEVKEAKAKKTSKK